MGQLVLLVVGAAWAAVLLPPLLRSRIENRPNSSVTDFRNQLSSLHKALPPRSVTVRSLARPLVPPPPLPPPPSPLRRPAAAGRPVLRSGVRTHQRAVQRTTLPAPQHRTPPPLPAEVHSRNHGSGARAADRRRHRPTAAVSSPEVVDDGLKRRRANILFVLVLIAGSSLFLAATMQEQSMYYVAGAAFVGLCTYVYLLVQKRKQEIPATRDPAPVAPRLRRDELDDDLNELPVHRRAHRPTVRYEERPARTRRRVDAGERRPRRERVEVAEWLEEDVDAQPVARQRPLLPDVPGEPTASILRAHAASDVLDEPALPRRRPRPRPVDVIDESVPVRRQPRQPEPFGEAMPPRRRTAPAEQRRRLDDRAGGGARNGQAAARPQQRRPRQRWSQAV
ncbi:hypothetical protein BH18ACT2_BH18ACT2_17420 [soil metagenome]